MKDKDTKGGSSMFRGRNLAAVAVLLPGGRPCGCHRRECSAAGQSDRDRGDRPRGDTDRELPGRAGRRRRRRSSNQQGRRHQGPADRGQVLQHELERQQRHGVRPPGGLRRRHVRDRLPRDAVGPDHPDPGPGEHPGHRQPLGRQPDRLDEPGQLPHRRWLGEQLPGDPVRDEEARQEALLRLLPGRPERRHEREERPPGGEDREAPDRRLGSAPGGDDGLHAVRAEAPRRQPGLGHVHQQPRCLGRPDAGGRGARREAAVVAQRRLDRRARGRADRRADRGHADRLGPPELPRHRSTRASGTSSPT